MNLATVYVSTIYLASLSTCIYCSDVCSHLLHDDSEAACNSSSDDQGSAISLLQTSALQRRITSATRTSVNAELLSLGPEGNTLADAIRNISNSDVAEMLRQLQNPTSGSEAISQINTTCQQVPFLAGTVNMSVTQTLMSSYSALNDYMAALAQVQVQAQSTVQVLGDDSVYNWVSTLVYDLDRKAKQMQEDISKFLNSMRRELFKGLNPWEDANGNFNGECTEMEESFQKASMMVNFLTNQTTLLELMDGTNPVVQGIQNFGDWFWGHSPCKTPCCQAMTSIQNANKSVIAFAAHVKTFNNTDVDYSLSGAVKVVDNGVASINQTMYNDLHGETLPATISASTQTAWDALMASTSSTSGDITTLWGTVNTDVGTIDDGITTLFADVADLQSQAISYCPTTTMAPAPGSPNLLGPAPTAAPATTAAR